MDTREGRKLRGRQTGLSKEAVFLHKGRRGAEPRAWGQRGEGPRGGMEFCSIPELKARVAGGSGVRAARPTERPPQELCKRGSFQVPCSSRPGVPVCPVACSANTRNLVRDRYQVGLPEPGIGNNALTLLSSRLCSPSRAGLSRYLYLGVPEIQRGVEKLYS